VISGLGRRGIQKQSEDLFCDRVEIFIPSYTDCTVCGFDAVTRSAKDISCTTCNGTGRTETWATATIRARASWTDVGRPRFGGAVTTEDIGDAWITVRLAHKTLMEDVRDSENAYVLLDGRRLRVTSVDVNRVEGRTTCVARCEIVRD
jgi:ribosomal protein L37AE/L43A